MVLMPIHARHNLRHILRYCILAILYFGAGVICAVGARAQGAAPAAVTRVRADWPQWRGPNRDSISPETGLALNWDVTPPKPLWQVNVGIGYSSMAVAAGKLYTEGWNWRSGENTVVCLNAVTGKLVWKYSYAAGSGVWLDVGRGHVPEFLGPRGTPTVEAGRVYTLGTDGHAFCFDADDGKIIWQRQLAKDADAHLHNEWWLAASPLVVGNEVILGSKGGGIAVAKDSGKTLWIAGGEVAGLSSPQLFQYLGKPCLFLRSSITVSAVDPETGTKVWHYHWGNSYDSADPLIIGDKVLLCGAYSHQSLLVPIGGTAPLWQGNNVIPEVASPILYNGLIYSQTGYIGGPITCVDPADGKTKFITTEKQGFVNQLLADGKIIASSIQGGVSVYDILPDHFQLLGHYTPPWKQQEDSWENQPILAQGRLYLRSWRGDLIALDVSGDDAVTAQPLLPTVSASGPRYAELASPPDKLAPAPFQAPVASDWRQWRGPRRDGVLAETGVKFNWNAHAPQVKWRLDIGYGYASVVGAGDRIYTTGWRQGEDMRPEFVWCLDARTGRVIWKYQYTSRESGAFLDVDLGKMPQGMGPRATPLLEGDKLYSFTTTGDVYCLNAGSGHLVWTKNVERDLPEDNNVKRPVWNHGGAPLIIGDALILNAGVSGVALDKNTGAFLWGTGAAAGGQANPVFFTQQGQPRVAIQGATALNIIDPADGKMQWSLPCPKAPFPVIPDPLIVGESILLTNNTGGTLTPLGGDKPIWSCAALQPKVGTPILYNGYLYSASQPGGQAADSSPIQYGTTITSIHTANQSDGELLCVNAANGTVKWRKKLPVTQLLLSGNTLIMQGKHGDISLATATADGYKPLGTIKVLDSDECLISPAIINGRLFCRSWEGELVCVDLHEQ